MVVWGGGDLHWRLHVQSHRRLFPCLACALVFAESDDARKDFCGEDRGSDLFVLLPVLSSSYLATVASSYLEA